MRTPYTPHTGPIVIGTKVHCILYGGMDGIVFAVHGKSSPESCGSLGGCVSRGGSAYYDIVFDDHTSNIPESLVRTSVQWRVYPEVASAEEIAAALARMENAKAVKAAEAKAADDRRAAERLVHAASNPHLLKPADRPTWCSARVAAENIRRELKRRFPATKFKVTSDHNSVTVAWTDGPTGKSVREVADRHVTGSWDGMNDIYSRDNDATFADVFGGAKYLSVSRSDTLAAVRAAYAAKWSLTPEKAALAVPEDWNSRSASDSYHIRETWKETAF